MIKSFKHKGLAKFFHNDDRSRINQKHASKLARILDRLDASVRPQDMNLPGYKLHALSGKEKELGQFGLPAIGESRFSLMGLMQWPLIIEIIIKQRRACND